MRKTAAWPLSQAWVALVVYASLYPFSGWRDQGVAPWAYLTAPLPHWWTGFDVAANLAGYAPLGFLLALAMLRRSRCDAARPGHAILVATLSSALLSMLMEALQGYLPERVPSNVDFVLNTLGALAGALLAGALEKAGAIARWGRFRLRWFVEEARGALVLLALWPFALLFPAPVAFGLGQVYERIEAAVADWLDGTPFLEWLPVRDVELQPLVPVAELLCVALGVLVPCLVAGSVLRGRGQRLLGGLATVVVGVGVTALSAALSWGPAHAWAWLSLPVQLGLGLGLALACAGALLPARAAAAVALPALVLQLTLLNQAPASAYFTHTLRAWEQGRFISFYGLAQWLGWLWPYLALAWLLLRVARQERAPRIRA